MRTASWGYLAPLVLPFAASAAKEAPVPPAKSQLRVIPPLSERLLEVSEGEAIDFSSSGAVAFVSGVFSSLGESSRVLDLGASSVLGSNVGSIHSSFEERVSFKPDSPARHRVTHLFHLRHRHPAARRSTRITT